MSEIAIPQSNDSPPWGRANPNRGANHEIAAMLFVRAFPIGSTLSVEKFDEWAESKKLLAIPDTKDKKSDAWVAHLQRRHQLRYNINMAGSHPRMETPFTIDTVKAGSFIVRAPEAAFAESKITRQVESLLKTKQKQLAYLLQSSDWAAMPSYERIFAESLFDDIDAFAENVSRNAGHLNGKFDRLRRKLEAAVNRGDITPRNGGIKAILESSND